MFRIVRGALWARRAQAATILVLGALAVAVAAAAPWYVRVAARSVAVADVAEAAPAQLVVHASGSVEGPSTTPVTDGAQLVHTIRGAAGAVARVEGAASIVSIRETGSMSTSAGRVPLVLGYRDGVCDHLLVQGACPRAADEVLLSRRTADQIQAVAGDTITFVSTSVPDHPVRVVGTYDVPDPLEPYWALTVLGAASGLTQSRQDSGDPAFTDAGTFAALPLRQIVVDDNLLIPRDAFLGDDGGGGLAASLDRQMADARTWRIETGALSLTERIARERRMVDLGVGVAAIQLLLLCWFGLFFAVRHAAEQRRPDIGLLKLRGTGAGRLWTLSAGQTAVPLVLGAVAGAALANAVVLALFAHDVGGGPQVRAAAVASGFAAAAALAGALVAAVAADARGRRAGITDLLRHVPARRRGWRGDVVDLIVVVVAAAGLYQAHVAADSGGLALLAPALVALVVALVAARALTPLAGRAGEAALRTGRIPLAIGATQLARRPGTHRVFALLVVSVALVTTAVGGWTASVDARAERAVHDVGADRVLTVRARSRGQLLQAVRAADPGGRYAMAVVRGAIGPIEDVLAVDASRLAPVASWQESYGQPGPAALAALIRPPQRTPVAVPDGPLTVEASATDGANPVHLVVRLATVAGDPVDVRFGPLTAEPAEWTRPVAGCGAAGCRLIGFELVAVNPGGRTAQAEQGTSVAVRALTAGGRPVVPVSMLRDVSHWRASVDEKVRGPILSTMDGGLTITAGPPGGEATRSTRAYVVDAPVPLPVVRTGSDIGDDTGEPRLEVGGASVPVRTVAVTGALPYATNVGYLVDLEYADRVSNGAAAGDVPQVWLAADAPTDIVERLAAQGLAVTADDSVAAAGRRLDKQGPPSALRFQLLAALVGLLLTAGAFTVVAAVERPERAQELAALRVQGLPTRAVRAVAYGGYGGLAVACMLLGVAAGALALGVTRRPLPLFVDGWHVLPTAVGPQPAPLLIAVAVAVVVVGVVSWAAAAQLVRAVDGARS
jgi:hypothetical protein